MTRRTIRRYAHELFPHGEEGETRWATYSQQAKNSRHPVRNRNEKGQYA